ncbi:MAG TPA: FGGY-family carbohydrate kinase, partial [Anaerolineae bacterium]|nr:FGGY-family carbohydrate kinase [Anaerolineae bacterium]
PEIWNQVRYTPTTTSYLVEKLTGHLSIDRPTAQGYGSLFDLSNGRWDMAECERLGLSAELFPQEIVGSRDIVGTMTEQAACSTGLAQGIPVIAGTIDAFAEMLSAAVVAPGDACLLYGSFVALLVARVRRRLSDGPIHCLEDLAFDGAGVQTGGALIRWFRDTFARAELQVENEGGQNAYATLDELAEAIPPGAEGLLALPRFEGSPGGAWFGLTLGHRREHLYRSLLEGIAFEVRRQLEEEHVAIPSQLVAVGGGSQSQLWTQIMSDVLGVTQLCTEYPLGAPLGIAYLAGMGAGLISGFERLKNQWLRVGRVVQPELAERFVYDRAYRAYCQEFQQRFGQQGAN